MPGPTGMMVSARVGRGTSGVFTACSHLVCGSPKMNLDILMVGLCSVMLREHIEPTCTCLRPSLMIVDF